MGSIWKNSTNSVTPVTEIDDWWRELVPSNISYQFGMIQDLYLRRLNHNISSPLPAFPRHLVPIFSTSKYFLTEHFDFDTYQPHTAGSIPKKRTREPRERRVERADVATSLSDRTIITSQSYLSYSSSKNCFLCGIMVSSAALILNKLRRLRSYFAFFCFVGIALSSYAFYVETKKEHDDSYVAMCDINESMSCTKVFSSKYNLSFPFPPLWCDSYWPFYIF